MLLDIHFDQRVYESISRLLSQVHQATTRVSASASTSHIELELRWKTNSTFFNQLKARLLRDKSFAVIETMDEVTSRGDARRIDDKNANVTFQHKQKIGSVDFPIVTTLERYAGKSITEPQLTFMRLGAAVEHMITYSQFQSFKERDYKRSRVRSSFVKDTKSYTIDLTIVRYEDKQEPEYQIQIELHDGQHSFESLKSVLQNALGEIFPTFINLFTADAYKPFGYVRVERGKFPVNIQQRHVKEGLSQYFVTNKLDGTAYSLFLRQLDKYSDRITLFAKNNNDCWILADMDKRSFLSLPGCSEDILTFCKDKQFRCEHFIPNPRQPNISQLHLYDIFAYHIRAEDELAIFENRIIKMQLVCQSFQSVLRDVPHVTVFVKTFFDGRGRGTSGTWNLLKAMDDTFSFMLASNDNDEKKVQHNNDGIIFQPNEAWQFSPLKWKYPSKVTVDFAINKDPILKSQKKANGEMFEYYLYSVFATGESGLQLYKLEEGGTSMSVFLMCVKGQMFDGVSADSLKGLVVECGNARRPKSSTNPMIVVDVHRIRFDKSTPNYVTVVDDTMKDMLHPLTIEILRSWLKEMPVAVVKERVSFGPSETIYGNNHQDIIHAYYPLTHLVYTQRVQANQMESWPTIEQSNRIVYRILERGHADLQQLVCYAPDSFFFEMCSQLSLANNTNITNAVLCTQSSDTRGQFNLKYARDNLRYYQKYFRQLCLVCDVTPSYFFKHEQSIMDMQSHFDLPNQQSTSDAYRPRRTLAVLFSNGVSFDDLQYVTSSVDTAVFITRRRIDDKRKLSHPVFSLTDEASRFPYFIYIFEKNRDVDMLSILNNDLKRDIINKYCGEHVLDLGSGKGGDIHKYQKAGVKHLTCIEPSSVHYDEMMRRVSDNASNVDVSKCSFHHSDALSYLEGYGGEGVFDTVAMFFVLTFFFEDENKCEQLCRGIRNMLRRGGCFIGTATNGAYLKSILTGTSFPLPIKSGMGTVTDVDEMSRVDSRISYENGVFDSPTLAIEAKEVYADRAFGNTITFDLKGSRTATSQTEWLVDWKAFISCCARNGLYLLHTSIPQQHEHNSPVTNLLIASSLGFVFYCPGESQLQTRQLGVCMPCFSERALPGYTNAQKRELERMAHQSNLPMIQDGRATLTCSTFLNALLRSEMVQLESDMNEDGLGTEERIRLWCMGCLASDQLPVLQTGRLARGLDLCAFEQFRGVVQSSSLFEEYSKSHAVERDLLLNEICAQTYVMLQSDVAPMKQTLRALIPLDTAFMMLTMDVVARFIGVRCIVYFVDDTERSVIVGSDEESGPTLQVVYDDLSSLAHGFVVTYPVV